MRRLTVLFIVALLGAGFFGYSNFSSGISANGTKLSSKAFRSEITAITTNPNLQCYVSALTVSNFSSGAGKDTVSSAATAAWANILIEGTTIDQYVTSHFHVNFSSPGQKAQAISSLEAEMSQAAKSNSLSCPGSSADAVKAMPGDMKTSLIEAQSASLFLLSKLDTTIPMTLANIKAYYAQHISDYDTICVSVAVVAPSQVSAFTSAQSSGASVSELAKTFSVDKSAANGGTYGCYSPTSSSYASVRSDTVKLALNTYSAPQGINNGGQTYALYVAATKRTPTPFAQAINAVVSDVQNVNATSASTVKQNILYAAAVSVDPAFGRWGLNQTTGPGVFAPALPATTSVVSPGTLSTANTQKYQ